MTDEQKKALKEAAEKAQAEPHWEVQTGEYESVHRNDCPCHDTGVMPMECDPATVLALLADLERLEGIVAKLPKTADGVPVVPGEDKIWWCPKNPVGEECHQIPVGCGGLAVAWQFLPDCGEQQVRVGECYSTEAAARAALAREVPNG